LLTLAGGGIGPMYPVTTVLTQNAVPRHQIGVATGTLNFFRLLGGTIVVAGFGAIVLAGDLGALASPGLSHGPVSHGPGSQCPVSLGRVSPGPFPPPGGAPADFSSVFAWVFAAAAGCLTAALAALLMVEERPLRGPDSSGPKAA